MSTVSSATSSAVAYATQLAQSSALKRSLYNIGNAIDNGDMTTANSLITTFIQNNPQYAAGSSSASSTDPISQDFQTLATAVSGNQVAAAQSAWTQVKNDLTKDGVSLSSNAESTAAVVAQSKASINQSILSNVFGSSAGGSPSVSSLIGGGGDSGSVGLSSSLLNSWLTYNKTGTVTPAAASSTADSSLDTVG